MRKGLSDEIARAPRFHNSGKQGERRQGFRAGRPALKVERMRQRPGQLQEM